MGHEQHTVTVFAPVLYLTVTVESTSSGADEVHIHPGGQGFWIARMLKHLDERPLLCGPLGGESGRVFRGLLSQFGMDVSAIDVAHSSPTIVQDRRSGQRVIVAEAPSVSLARHEIDDVYGRFLDRALASAVCVITGQSNPIFPVDIYRRMGHDLESAEVEVVADLHGPELRAFLEGGPIDVLKVSDEDLTKDGLLPSPQASETRALDAIADLRKAGARAVMLSRQDRPALARSGDDVYVAKPPKLHPADDRGAGDSMTAGLVAGLRRGLDFHEVIRLGCAAGAANVTRHGLGSAEEGLISELMERVEVTQLSGATV